MFMKWLRDLLTDKRERILTKEEIYKRFIRDRNKEYRKHKRITKGL